MLKEEKENIFSTTNDAKLLSNTPSSEPSDSSNTLSDSQNSELNKAKVCFYENLNLIFSFLNISNKINFKK